MTTISRDDVRHLAQLSGVRLDEDEAADLQIDISNILAYVQQLAELDTTNVEPTYQVTTLKNVWRDDQIVDDAITREQLLDLAPDAADHQIKVPKVL